MAARVRHDSVVTVYGIAHHDGAVGLSMELVEGKTISELLKEQGPMSPHEASVVGARLCGALAAIHAAGFVHGDVKAQNVMRQVGGRIVLMDFSSSSRRIQGESPDPIHAVSGTPLYMAPEVLDGAGPTRQSDIYSLGVFLYHALTGRFPVEGSTLEELRQSIRYGPRDVLLDLRQDIPRPFAAAIESALDPDPAKRPASAGQFEVTLRSAIDGAAAGSAGGAVPYPWPWSARTNWIISGVLAIALSVGGIGMWWINRPYQVDVRVFKTMDDGVTTEVTQGSAVGLDGEIHLELRCDRDIWLYVISADDSGYTNVLSGIPIRGLGYQNPIRSGGTTHVPVTKDGAPATWTRGFFGAKDHILLLASPHRLRKLETDLAKEDDEHAAHIAGLASRPAPTKSERSLSPAPSAATPPKGTSSSPLQEPSSSSIELHTDAPAGASVDPSSKFVTEEFDRITASARLTRGVWTRRIDLGGSKP